MTTLAQADRLSSDYHSDGIMSNQYSFTPVAQVHSPYRQKFGIPRQPRLTTSIITRIELLPGFDRKEMLRGLEQCSHIWLLFIFNATADQGWRPTVRPPRLQKKKLGVFATRSPFRPNPIGMSAVKLENIIHQDSKTFLQVSGADLLDGTPIIDIKPYLPYSDCVTEAQYDLVAHMSELQQPVIFTTTAQQQCEQLTTLLGEPLQTQITELLRCDPRPAYDRHDDDREFGVQLHDVNIRFCIRPSAIEVRAITHIKDN
ncbi:tRNA (N6-threonylcarbamoyladenosine(37)-N6)-methyltransferase TrmO [Pontibacter sp. JAM-7]|uniref:tRNA (N6-threonylcarbamoyladenosine(37)-N6)-methyltransferase TrmO n=1 Tax=Pontibacter sp. JAM-7 TaxID=3366581 RepID=UPI003AF838F8